MSLARNRLKKIIINVYLHVYKNQEGPAGMFVTTFLTHLKVHRNNIRQVFCFLLFRQ